MINYYDGQIADIMPHNLMDAPASQAFSYAIREGTRLLHRYTQICYAYCSIDTAPDKVLDLLAKELRTQYYNDSLDINTKRSLVRNTLIWYMTAGTPAAVEELVTVAFGEGKVVEWFEYDGKPYWFKIRTSAILNQELVTYFWEMIKRVKNTRSHLEALEIERHTGNVVFAGCGTIAVYHPAPIIDGHKMQHKAMQTIFTGMTGTTGYYPAAIFDGHKAQRKISQNTHAGEAEMAKYYPAAILHA
ncbi:phage tail protein [Marvinbryantia formatexigens]|nr:phage tail protein [Marvinbryantia formatexigens]UWO25302.1 phage tail protein [Marvinbryantia formatexigens DSM 14469]SDG98346.1 Phage tail protein (Tail_P2_I) [Marvinbryantia formatexigens]